jgi:hypothetical protein
MATILAITPMAAPAMAHDPDPNWPANPDWQSLVPGPSSDDVKPVAITRAHGGVTNPEALFGGGGTTTLTMEPGGPPAVIVLDYGQEVGGTPYLNVASTSGSNSVRISTSEVLRFLNANATTTLLRDATAGQSNVKVVSAAPFYVGAPITIDGATSETRDVTAVGTAAAPNTLLVLPAQPGDASVNVASVNGYAIGGPLTIGTGADVEEVTITAVGTAAGAPTTLVYPAAIGDTNVKVASVAGFAAGQRVLLDAGGNIEVLTAVDVGTPATTTRLFSGAAAGDGTVYVTNVSGLTVGAEIDVDPGPNQDHVTITTVGTAGVNTTVAAANTTSGLPVPSVSGANWIWSTATGTSNAIGPAYLRKHFSVADPTQVTIAPLRVNGDDSAVIYVNGVSLGQTSTGNNGWRTSTIVDVAPLLVAGDNVIALQVVNPSSSGSAIAALEVHTAGDVARYVSDTSWKALAGNPATGPDGWTTAAFDDTAWGNAFISTAYGGAPWNSNITEPAGPTTLRVASVANFAAGDTISIDTGASQETRTVVTAGGTGANAALTVSEPFATIHSIGAAVLNLTRPGTGVSFTPALANAHDVLSTVASPGTGITFSTGIGAAHAGGTAIRGAGSGIGFTPTLTGDHAAGTTVASSGTGITFSPALSGDHAAGATATGIGTYVNDNGAQINLTVDTAQTYTGGLRGGFRFEAIELRSPGTVTLTGAGLNFRAYRATADKYEGWFLSSDSQLNDMWYAGAYTAQMDMVPVGVAPCFTVPVLFDGAKRDRAIWSGDLMVTDPVAMLSIGSNSHEYVRGSIDSILNLQAASGRLTSAVGFRGCGAFDYAMTYSAYSAIIAVQYYRYTGDTAYVTGILPKLEAATAYHATRLDANGLVVTNDNDYWQTRQDGEVTEYSLAYYELLQDMIWLESHVGTPEKVVEYTDKAAALKAAINARLFNVAAGLYQHTDSRPDVFPLDANMNAIRLGVAPAESVKPILDFFQANWVEHGSQISQPAPSFADPFGHTIEPLNNTWEMMARIRSDDAAGAIELLRRLWGLQVDRDSGFYTGTFWEFVMADGLPNRGFDSLAHAWGAGPTQILTEAVLGATAVNPGYATWTVKPQPIDLTWAQGMIPTAFGGLSVKWAQSTASGKLRMEVTAPTGTSGEVWVPLSSATSSVSFALTTGATFLRRSGSYDVYSVGAGTHKFTSAPVTFASLKQLVAKFSSRPLVTLGLNVTLTAASITRNAKVRAVLLKAFVAQVKAQTDKAFTRVEADLLILLSPALR